jgi:arylsulfatase A-like enzyme
MWDVHYDYIPPARYVQMFDPEYRGPLDGRDIIDAGFPLDLPPRDLEHLLARYDGEIRWTDDTIATMLRMLEDAGLLADTLVVVTSDHGDEFLEHGDKGHQKTLHEEVTRVPLIFWAADGVPAGRVVEQPVALADVLPTVLDALGLPPAAGVEGRSLVPLWRGETTTHPPVAGMLFLTYGSGAALVQASIRDGQRKLLYVPHGRQWREYALDRDPGEQAPLPVTRADLQADLDDRMQRAQPALVRRLATNTAQRTTPAVPAHVTDHLRALGYVEGGALKSARSRRRRRPQRARGHPSHSPPRAGGVESAGRASPRRRP